MNTNTKKLYRQLSARGIGHIVGRYAACCLRGARVIDRFRTLEAAGKVRIIAEPEQESYFDVYGEPDTEAERKQIIESIDRDGLWIVIAQVACGTCGAWQSVDSVGMCIYSNPVDPMENDYVIDLMESAIAALGK